MARDNKSDKKGSHHATMSKEQAGHLGGKAPHTCRGRKCSEKEDKSGKSSNECW